MGQSNWNPPLLAVWGMEIPMSCAICLVSSLIYTGNSHCGLWTELELPFRCVWEETMHTASRSHPPNPMWLCTAGESRRGAVVLGVKLQQGKGRMGRNQCWSLQIPMAWGVGYFSLLGSSKFLGIFCRLWMWEAERLSVVPHLQAGKVLEAMFWWGTEEAWTHHALCCPNPTLTVTHWSWGRLCWNKNRRQVVMQAICCCYFKTSV